MQQEQNIVERSLADDALNKNLRYEEVTMMLTPYWGTN